MDFGISGSSVRASNPPSRSIQPIRRSSAPRRAEPKSTSRQQAGQQQVKGMSEGMRELRMESKGAEVKAGRESKGVAGE